MNKVNILLVDDQPGKLLSYESVLAELGENLVLARSGREALQQLLRQEFALILLDVVMPDMDGFDTATMIRQHPRLEHTPIIFLTAFSTSDFDRLRGYKLGAVDYVFAPVVPEILRAKVAVFVELHRKRRELFVANQKLQFEIAERKRAQEQALQAERLAAIGEMVTGLAHESRNALQLMQASSEMLMRRLNGTGEHELVLEIQKAQDRLIHLFDEVSGYAAPIRLVRERHELAKLWREAWQQVTALAKDRDIRLVEAAGSADTRCAVDPFSMERVFRNVLENSIAAAPDPVTVEIQCAAARLGEGDGVRVVIRDNGPGLTCEQRQKIFVPFYTTKVRGTGLGMAIAKRIVEAHGGVIGVGQCNGAGTAIEITLPKG
ncbi:MAG: response regulator [Gemmataceae bacterium]|nr:response regulator [Gemmataceae bacterium]